MLCAANKDVWKAAACLPERTEKDEYPIALLDSDKQGMTPQRVGVYSQRGMDITRRRMCHGQASMLQWTSDLLISQTSHDAFCMHLSKNK
jgi:hypothetical protein